MPRLMPAWRNAFIVADAMPARSAGTWAITAMPVAGTAKPMPMPSSISKALACPRDVAGWNVAIAHSATATST
ncbi:hypothetical protein G6F40_017021 [Rhizopus arrhizus]|uniref:Uncharacterized protein n=1 Tax=Rhizopus oryzae TaxID=64495 RepID=A0A9P6XLV5_RHIOR|nr:hypothetical protein G6F40_017021 [Rhizopus arrhizus]KAG1522836.1 hypothetical protein G6F51_014574 [Rhizopus arrhizus]